MSLKCGIVGLPNVGKSTLFNALTKAGTYAADQLFATLDTTSRRVHLDGVGSIVVSDTVGFIQQLPHQLIEAFKSTLSELQYADLLLQVVDISDPNWEAQIKVVLNILAELEVDKPMLFVFNKADRIADLPALEQSLLRYQPHVIISAQSKEGLVPLTEFLKAWNT